MEKLWINWKWIKSIKGKIFGIKMEKFRVNEKFD